MNLINEIKLRLKKYPDLEIVEEEKTIYVKPNCKNGFEVWASEDQHEYTVGFEGWHQHFDKSEADDALNCFALGLSNECRLKVSSKNGKSYKWVMEALENGNWVEYSTTALFNLTFWKREIVDYYSNDILK